MVQVSWTSPSTWVAGIPTVTQFNTDVRDNMRELWHEIAYTEFTANVTATTGGADVVSSGAITYLALPTVIEFSSPRVVGGVGPQIIDIHLWDAAFDQGILARYSNAANTVDLGPLFVQRRLTPTAASHTFKIQAQTDTAGATICAGAGGGSLLMPGYIRVLQKGG